MNEPVKEYRTGNKILKIFRDENPLNPRKDYSNLGKMICFHKKYDLGDNHDWTVISLEKKLKEKGIIALPLYLYNHSGVTIQTNPFSCSWDSGKVGYIFVTKEDIKREYGIKKISKKIREEVKRTLKSEVKTYDNYLTGEVYSYTLEEEDFCERCKQTQTDLLDSCSGYYGETATKNILADVESLTGEERKNLKGV